MIDYEYELKAISKLKSVDAINDCLDRLPEGLYIGKKVKIGSKIFKYSYTEKEREIMKHIHGLDIDKETVKMLVEEH